VPRAVPVIGNGDITTFEDYARLRNETGCDGVMIGRGAMGNPWLFRAIRAHERGQRIALEPTPRERFSVVERHIELCIAHASERKRLAEIRKVCAWYSRKQRGGAELRAAAFSERDVDRLLMMARNYFESLCGVEPILTTADASALNDRDSASCAV
jgi:tRNA-dihydrouridine synthase